LSGCETENKYIVYAGDQNGNIIKDQSLFKCKEKSSCMARQCLSGDCRPFKLNVEYKTKMTGLPNDGMDWVKCQRDYALTYLCCNRPVMDVTIVENNENRCIGKIRAPWKCMNMQLDIMTPDDQIIYTIWGSCCQIGVHCPFPCETCQTVNFEVRDASGNVVAPMQKRSAGCMKAALSDADFFTLTFPTAADKDARALLTMAVIFLDFRYFEVAPANNVQGGGY
jgi:hypothetical protein